jgi:hypothetical protein
MHMKACISRQSLECAPCAVDSKGRRNTLIFFGNDGVLRMGYRQRIYVTEKQNAEIWDRCRRGESMSSIGRRFDRNS